MELKKEEKKSRFNYTDVEEAAQKTKGFLKSVQISTGAIEIIVIDKDFEKGGENMVTPKKKKSVEEKLHMLDKIIEKGKVLDKETLEEMFRIGERDDKEWGSNIE